MRQTETDLDRQTNIQYTETERQIRSYVITSDMYSQHICSRS